MTLTNLEITLPSVTFEAALDGRHHAWPRRSTEHLTASYFETIDDLQ
jgi:hypothetical protein